MWAKPRAMAPFVMAGSTVGAIVEIIVGAIVGALVGAVVAITMTTIYDHTSATLETSISTQEKGCLEQRKIKRIHLLEARKKPSPGSGGRGEGEKE